MLKGVGVFTDLSLIFWRETLLKCDLTMVNVIGQIHQEKALFTDYSGGENWCHETANTPGMP